MKSVLISIQPKWCELIASGKKTIEVRKTAPKDKEPFKVYIYQTKKKWIYRLLEKLGLYQGKVIGEFVYDKIDKYRFDWCGFTAYGKKDFKISEKQLKSTCLKMEELIKYGTPNGHNEVLYGWHIYELRIYDKPKELEEFYTYSKLENYDFCAGCHYHEMPITEFPCSECKHNAWERNYLTRPPQSWFYVEE